ncbi:MAG: autotransporter-associated beta strand repeat-containing protein [Luteolibacter sp.]
MKPKGSLLPLILCLCASASTVHAVTWTGATNATWSTAGNWTPAAPTSTDTATFDSNSTANQAITLTAAATVAGITVSGAPTPISISGNFALNAGAVSVSSGNQLTFQNGASNTNLTFSALSGAGTVVISKAGTINVSNNATTTQNMATANALNFTGSLVFRGGTASSVPGTMASSWTAVGGAALTQATGTSFSLDTGDSASNARDLIVTDAFTAKTLTLSSLSGYGAMRSDWGGSNNTTYTRTVRIEQNTDTTFNGLFLSHHSTANVIRNLALVKAGTGILTMNGIVGRQTASAATAGTDQVPITVETGTLVLAANNTRLGAATISSGATLQIGNGGATGLIGASTATVSNDGTLAFNHGAGASISVANVISGGGSIVKRGASSLALTAASTTTGTITVEAGTLRLGNHFDTAPVTVKSGAAIGAGDISTAGTGTVKSLTLEAGSLSTLRATDQLVISDAGGLHIGGTHILTPVATVGLTPGTTTTVIDYNGTLDGSPSNLQLAPGSRFQLIHDAADTSFKLQYVGGAIIWNGTAGSAWDLDTTTNWTLASDSSATHFLQGDQVTFNDTAATGNVVLSGTLQPTSVTFDNSSLPYTLSGTAITGAGSLVKRGTSSATLAIPSAYTGTTTVEAGTLVIGDGTTNGDIGSGAVIVQAGGTLRFNRSNNLDYKTTAKMRNVSGAGNIVIEGGGLFFNYTGTGLTFAEANSWSGFSGHLTIKGGSEFQTIRNGATAMGTGTVTLGDATTSGAISGIEGNWTFTNPIELAGPDNHINNRAANGPRTMKLQGVISGAGNLTFQDIAVSMTNAETGFILTGANTLTGTITIPSGVPVRIGGVPGNTDTAQSGPSASGTLGGATVVDNGTLTFSRTDSHEVANSISGTGSVVVGLTTFTGTASQTVSFTGDKTYSGTTTVHNGRLLINGTLPNSAVTVDASGSLGGTGTTGAAVTVNGTLAPGNATVGKLTASAGVSLSAASRYQWEISDWDGLDGTGYDTLSTTTLAVNSTTESPAVIVITPASLVNFTAANRVFTLATTSAGITGLDTGKITVDATAFTGGGTWSVQAQGNLLKLVYTAPLPNNYEGWAQGKGLTGNDALRDADPDHDGVKNVLEYLFGTEPNPANPGSNSTTAVPTLTVTPTTLDFVYRRTAASALQIEPVIQCSAELQYWLTADSSLGVTRDVQTDGFGPGIDKVTVHLPLELAASGPLFVRLVVQEQ